MEHKRSMTEEDKELIFPEAHSTVNQILETIDDFGVNPTAEQVEYGHAIGLIMTVAYANCETDFEEQKRRMRACAQEILKKRGPEFAQFLHPDLKKALGIDV